VCQLLSNTSNIFQVETRQARYFLHSGNLRPTGLPDKKDSLYQETPFCYPSNGNRPDWQANAAVACFPGTQSFEFLLMRLIDEPMKERHR
jgi:hypothetical protein